MTELLSTEGVLTPESNRTHIHFGFRVSEPIERLHVELRYQPKTLDDKNQAVRLLETNMPRYLEHQRAFDLEHFTLALPLKNLLTVSLDDPYQFRGMAHRQPSRQELYISETDATPGFIFGPLPVGDWRSTLSVHAVVTDSCTYQLRIWEGASHR